MLGPHTSTSSPGPTSLLAAGSEALGAFFVFFVLIFGQPLCRSCEVGVPVQRGRKGDGMTIWKLDHRALEAGGFFV